MNSKVWLIVFGVVAVLVLGGGGYYAATSYGKHQEAIGGWSSKVASIESLERRVPYPNEENTEALTAKVETYKKSVSALSETLKSFNRPLNTTLANTEFQQRVKTRVEEFRKKAAEAGLEIDSSTDFQLGFDSYANTVPAPALVPVLDYELEAIDHLLRLLVDCGAEFLGGFQRDAIPGETGGAEKHESGVVHKYPVRFRFRGNHEAFQKFVNALANDRQFFYIVRVMKVRNEMSEGPLKATSASGGGSFTRFENPITKEVASPEKLAEWGADGASEAAIAEKAKAEGFIKADQDAVVLMGLEKLETFVVVDITRFLTPEELAAAAPEAEPKKGKTDAKKGRR